MRARRRPRTAARARVILAPLERRCASGPSTTSLALGLSLSVLAAPSLLAAQEDEPTVTAALRVVAPADAECPSEAEIVRAVEAQLGRAVFDASAAEVFVIGGMRHEGSGWTAELELQRADGTVIGTRILRTPSPRCVGLADTLPLVIALMVDLPRSRVEIQLPPPIAPPAAAPPPSEAPPSPVARDPALSAPAPRAEEPFAFHVGVGAGGALGWLPGIALGLAIELAIVPDPRVRIALRAAFHPPWDADAAHGGLRTWAAGGAIGAALRFLAEDPLALDAALELGVGMFEAESTGVSQPLRAQGPTIDARAGIDAVLALGGPWSLVLDVRIGTPILPPRFDVLVDDARTTVFTASPLFGRLGLGLRLESPR